MEALAQLVKRRTNSNSPITFVPYDQAYEPGFEDMPRRVPALAKLLALTGFLPQIPLDDIVDGVISYFKDKKVSGTPKTAAAAGSGASGRMMAGSSAD
jgi:UDP-glucose 4-epimerase